MTSTTLIKEVRKGTGSGEITPDCFLYNTTIIREFKVPQNAKAETVKKLQAQHADFINILRYMGLDIIEISNTTTTHPPNSSSCSPSSLKQECVDMVGDLALVLNGVALILRPHTRKNRSQHAAVAAEIMYLRTILKRDTSLRVVNIGDRDACACGRDILFTGKEIFIGIGGKSSGTNLAGAEAVAATFPEYPTQILELPGDAKLALKNYVSVGGNGFLLMSETNRHSRLLVEQICAKGKFVYEYLDLPDLKAISSLFLNGCLLHLGKEDIQNSFNIIDEKIETHGGIYAAELLGKDGLFSSLCVLIKTPKKLPTLQSVLTSKDINEYMIK